MKELKTELQQTLQTQKGKSNQLIEETHTAYELGFSFLQETIKGFRSSLSAKSSVDEILYLIKEIYQTISIPEIPSNKVVCAQIQKQFNITFQKLDDLKHWFEEQMDPASSKGGSDQDN